MSKSVDLNLGLFEFIGVAIISQRSSQQCMGQSLCTPWSYFCI